MNQPKTQPITLKNQLSKETYDRLCIVYGINPKKKDVRQTDYFFDTENSDLLKQKVMLSMQDIRQGGVVGWEIVIQGPNFEMSHPLSHHDYDPLFGKGVIPSGPVADKVSTFTSLPIHSYGDKRTIVIYKNTIHTKNFQDLKIFEAAAMTRSEYLGTTEYGIEVELVYGEKKEPAEKWFVEILHQQGIMRVEPRDVAQLLLEVDIKPRDD